MLCQEIISGIKKTIPDFSVLSSLQAHPDEISLKINPSFFKEACLALHKIVPSTVMMLFASDERTKSRSFLLSCVFLNSKTGQWIIVNTDIPDENPHFDSLAKNMHSAILFEREIWEMFGIEPKNHPDLRSLNLHDEVWPKGNFPLRKDFKKSTDVTTGEYKFNKVEGRGVFEIPVGPVHAGIIGPGHFRFSVAGEPIINLETRLGFTHRGIEKLFEGKSCFDALRLSECVSGDSSFAHSMAFTHAAEKIAGILLPLQTVTLKAIFLELERLYNHVNDIAGIATDVGFSFPSAYASIIKESLLQLNEKLTHNRYLKNINGIGECSVEINETKKILILDSLKRIKYDFAELVKILFSSVSFMDRVDTTGFLRKKTAEDLGVVGLAGRACGIMMDLRKSYPKIYKEAGFKIAIQTSGDVLARLRIRIAEFDESCRLISEFIKKISDDKPTQTRPELKEGAALGYAEGWRGPVLYWVKTDAQGLIERCKIVDPSFHNWPALSYAVLGNIIPDFPLCNKSFDLSYSGNDL